MRHLRSVRHRRLIEKLKAARQAAGVSQRALAERLKRSSSYDSKSEAVGTDAAQIIRRMQRR